MKKIHRVLCLILVFAMSFCLQGCSVEDITTFSFDDLFKGETSHAVYRNEDYPTQFYIDLKTDTETGYEWFVYMTDSPDQLKEQLREGRLNHTNSSLTEYKVLDEQKFDLYLLLVKNGDIDGAKCFPYHIERKETRASIEEKDSYTLRDEPNAYKLLKDKYSK